MCFVVELLKKHFIVVSRISLKWFFLKFLMFISKFENTNMEEWQRSFWDFKTKKTWKEATCKWIGNDVNQNKCQLAS